MEAVKPRSSRRSVRKVGRRGEEDKRRNAEEECTRGDRVGAFARSKARCGRHGRRQRHCIEVKRLNPARTLRVKCLNCRVTVRKTARRLCERGIKEMHRGTSREREREREKGQNRGRVNDVIWLNEQFHRPVFHCRWDAWARWTTSRDHLMTPFMIRSGFSIAFVTLRLVPLLTACVSLGDS